MDPKAELEAFVSAAVRDGVLDDQFCQLLQLQVRVLLCWVAPARGFFD